MTDSDALSRLEPVALRDHWASEAYDFTPWLATEANLQLLSEAVEMDLEVDDTEVNVGPFRADILCRDGNDQYVLVENQLERTDHRHLGQVLTYAAGLDAAAIIWIAQTFTEQHRQALDWLNEITGEDFHFFGIEVELWRIADSPAAPRFNLVARPNDWQKAVRGIERASDSARAVMYRETWRGLLDLLQEHDLPIELPDATGMNQLRFPLPDGLFVLGYSPKKRVLSAYALVRGPDRPLLYQRLKAAAPAPADSLGVQFSWTDDADYGYGHASLSFDHEDEESVRQGADAVAGMLRALHHLYERERVTEEG